MNDLALRLWERVHGHLGWLSAVALVHPAVLLRRPRRRAPLAAGLAVAGVTAVSALGAWLYPRYRAELKQPLFLKAPSIGWLFERKEHLAVGAVALAWAGLLAHLAVPGVTEPEAAGALAKVAHRAFVASAVLALLTAAMGTVVASWSSFLRAFGGRFTVPQQGIAARERECKHQAKSEPEHARRKPR